MKRKALRRGAAFVEAIVTITVFIVLYLGLNFVYQLYAKKESARIEARAAAWTFALNSCEGDGGSVEGDDGANLDEVLADEEAGETPDLEAEGDQLVSEASNVQALEFGESWGVASATATQDPVNVFRFPTTEISSTQRVQCDEKPRGADPLAVLGFLWDLRNTVNLQ